jgi:formylglycine-generating enzyme required for sulfatase activity
MARIVTAALLLATVAAPSAWPQAATDVQLKQAGVCARCHVISVVEWGISHHQKAGTGCVDCHGASLGHVVDERNNIKPDRIPHAAAIAGLCATCHTAGCPKSKRTDACQSCHHVHALVDPNKPPVTQDERLDQLTRKSEAAARHAAEGQRLAKLQRWEQARAEFQSALKDEPGNQIAAKLVKVCERRLSPALAGFEIAGKDWDAGTGLAREVRIAELGTRMALVPGGDADIGSERFALARPVHTVHVESFYLGKYEVTRAEWKALMGAEPSVRKGPGDSDRLPVEHVSWEDAQAFVGKLNQRVPGGGFRLPTEAEWEYAARAGKPSDAATLRQVAWFDAPVKTSGPRPVGSRQANKLGLFDMQGNVWEWCSSLFLPYPYDSADGRESLTATGLRVLRGGGFADSADLLNPAIRHAERPQRRLQSNGLRIARTVPAP